MKARKLPKSKLFLFLIILLGIGFCSGTVSVMAEDPDNPNTLTYDFQIFADSQLTQLVASGTNILQGEGITSWQVTTNLTDESWYWWRVRSYDGICHSEWSQEWSFYVKAGELSAGDLNMDGSINVSDAVYLINFVFRGGPPPEPIELGDVNGDCEVDISDAVYLINYIFRSGPAPQPGCDN